MQNPSNSKKWPTLRNEDIYLIQNQRLPEAALYKKASFYKYPLKPTANGGKNFY